jgi:hypothetical protein
MAYSLGDGYIAIPEGEYTRLVERDEFLSCLEVAGVDNWGGYDNAFRILEGEEIY